MLDGVMRSFAFGATLAAAVGPIALLILGYGMRAGLKPAIGAGLGAALADLTYALAAFTVGSLLLARLVEHERVFRVGSAAALVGVGVWLMVQAVRRAPATAGAAGGGDLSRPLVTTYMLTLVNPLTIVIFTTFAAQLPLTVSRAAAAVFATSVFLGSLMVQMIFAAGGATLSRVVSRPGWIRALNMLSGAAIAAFGLTALIRHAA
jgi:threonine/homoserine/homoserine lactone efflux protein